MEIKQGNKYKKEKEHNMVKNLNCQEADQLVNTSVAKELNLRLPRIPPASSQNGIWTHDLQISIPMP